MPTAADMTPRVRRGRFMKGTRRMKMNELWYRLLEATDPLKKLWTFPLMTGSRLR
ncbi:hypothetical protein D3C73_1334150 [compost metagenome]